MSLFKIDTEKCAKDGICVEICPMDLITVDENNNPVQIKNAETFCIRCGHCVAVCPNSCFEHSELPLENFPRIEKNLEVSPEAAVQFLRKRRSVREFKDKDLPNDEIVKLIEHSRYAQSGHNSQGVQWKVVNGKDKVKKIASMVIDWSKILCEKKPEMAQMMGLDICVKKWENGKDMILRGAPAIIVAHSHSKDIMAITASTIALTYMELFATTMGIGTCWAGFLHMATNSYPPLKEALELPEDHSFNGAVMAGYPKYKYQRLVQRKDPVITWVE